ncbi:hypothetical protein Tco_0258001, partial [Tanacetum coccineum]
EIIMGKDLSPYRCSLSTLLGFAVLLSTGYGVLTESIRRIGSPESELSTALHSKDLQLSSLIDQSISLVPLIKTNQTYHLLVILEPLHRSCHSSHQPRSIHHLQRVVS